MRDVAIHDLQAGSHSVVARKNHIGRELVEMPEKKWMNFGTPDETMYPNLRMNTAGSVYLAKGGVCLLRGARNGSCRP